MPLYTLKIKGRVQGVAFRYSTQKQAERLGITGIVRNEPDGSVYAEIEGEETQLQQMIDWCRQGPSAARVIEVDVQSGTQKDYTSFDIIR